MFRELNRQCGPFAPPAPFRQALGRRSLTGFTLLALLMQFSPPAAYAQLEMLNTEEEIRKSDSQSLPEPAPEPAETPPGPKTQPKMQTATVTATSKPLASNSMLGRLLLAMAYERDPLLGKWIKKRKRTEPAAALGLISVYGVTMAQGINGVLDAYKEPITTNVHRGRLPILVPYTLTIVQAGLGLVTFVGISVWVHHCNRHIQVRQQELHSRVDRVLQKLAGGVHDRAVSQELSALVGEDAKDEYLKLWHVIHPHPNMQAEEFETGSPKSSEPVPSQKPKPAK